MRFSIKDFYSKCHHYRKLRIWSHLPENYLMENFILCAVGGILKPIKLLAAQNTAYTLRNRQLKQPFFKENEKNICIKEIYICKFLEIYRWIFFPAYVFSLLESRQLIAKYQASSYYKIAIERCSVKKMFIKILQNSQENPCDRVSFFNKVAA